MSEENVEAVRRGYEAINEFWRGELSSEDLLELLYVPEFEWSWHEGRRFPDEPQRLRGARAVLKFYEDMRDSLDELVIETHDYIEAPGDRVLVSCTHSGRGRESGVPFEVHYFQLWTVRRDGRAIKQELFRHRADALEAAGLRE